MKHSCIFFFSLLITISITGCDENSVPAPVASYPCIWNKWSKFCLVNPRIYLPTTTCETPFYNNNLSFDEPPTSFYSIMEAVAGHNITNVEDCSFTWESSVYAKSCDNGILSEPTRKQTWDQDDFWGNIYSAINSPYAVNGDLINEFPLIDTSYVELSDVKHTLTFQLYNVVNNLDGTTGTLTWTRTWLGLNASEFCGSGTSCWFFYFPPTGITGAYTPANGYTSRRIYVYNEFGYY